MKEAIIPVLKNHADGCEEKLKKLIQKMPLMPILDERTLRAYAHLASAHAVLEEEERGCDAHKGNVTKYFQRANDILVNFWGYVSFSRRIGCESKACVVDNDGLTRVLEDKGSIDQEIEKCKSILYVAISNIGYLPVSASRASFLEIKTSKTPHLYKKLYKKYHRKK